mmetsp:Transcript_7099/g.14602  ORF Transcript_7099/g.14602 Transcript_7099/m.14602 type:complete len:487 (-) Transcript_7099:1309-2769(-)
MVVCVERQGSVWVLWVFFSVLFWLELCVEGSPAVLSAAADVAGAKGSRKGVERGPLSEPSWEIYHRTGWILDRMVKLAKTCDVLEVERIKVPSERENSERDGSGRVATDTSEDLIYVRLTSAKKDNSFLRYWNRKSSMLVVFGEHGRELISSEIALRLVEIACGEYKPSAGLSAKEQQNVNRMRVRTVEELSRTEITLVPVASRSSRLLAENGNWCERLNERKVDVNRNWDYHFGEFDGNTIVKEEIPGPFPFSEKETRSLREISRRTQPSIYVSFHSGDQAIVLPWDHEPTPRGGAEGERLRYVADQVVTTHCPRCLVGNSKKLFGYSAFGTAVDYMHGTQGVPFAFTVEVYGDMKAPESDCFRVFNPTDRKSYESVVNTWAGSLATFSASVHERLQLERLSGKTYLNTSFDDNEGANFFWRAKSPLERDFDGSKAENSAEITYSSTSSNVAFICAGVVAFCLMLTFVRQKIFVDSYVRKISKMK